MTTVYLAWHPEGERTLTAHVDKSVPLLVALPMLDSFLRVRHKLNVSRWVLDSGAFSVHTGKAKITVDDLIARARDTDAAEVFGLDVIGDRVGTRRNLEKMWAAGVAAIPTLHPGATLEDVTWAKQAPKVALGGVARLRGHAKARFLRWGLSALWPHRIHVFGCTDEKTLQMGPWHSVDASTWLLRPARFAEWHTMPGVRTRPGKIDVWPEVLRFLRLGDFYSFRWRRQLAELEGA